MYKNLLTELNFNARTIRRDLLGKRDIHRDLLNTPWIQLIYGLAPLFRKNTIQREILKNIHYVVKKALQGLIWTFWVRLMVEAFRNFYKTQNRYPQYSSISFENSIIKILYYTPSFYFRRLNNTSDNEYWIQCKNHIRGTTLWKRGGNITICFKIIFSQYKCKVFV